MAGKTALVTGGNAGIGFEVCKQLIAQGAHVIVVCRRHDQAAMAALQAIPRGTSRLVLCDVSSKASVADLVAECVRSVRALDVLVLNAGVMLAERASSVDGLEMTLATNVVSEVAMIDGLLSLLSQSADPRVVLVASGGAMTETLVASDEEYATEPYDGTKAYARTKRMQIALAHYYARKHPNILFASMHPGWSDTPGVRVAMPGFFGQFGSRFRSAAEGADTISWLAAVQPRPEQNGIFWRDREPETEHFTLGGTSYPVDREEHVYNFLKAKWQ